MANEISINFSLTQTNGSMKTTIAPGTITVDQAAVGGHMPIISASTSVENIPSGDVSTLGLFAARNLDATNYVTVLAATSTGVGGTPHPFARLEAGEIMFTRLEPGTFPQIQANTATCKVQVWLFED